MKKFAVQRIARPGFRHRLTILFVLTVAITAGIVMIAVYFLARLNALDSASASARRRAAKNISFAQQELVAENRSPAFLVSMLSRSGEPAAIVSDGAVVSKGIDIDPRQLPSPAFGSARHPFTETRATINGRPYLVVGGMVPDTDVKLYSFFPQEQVWANLGELAALLAAGWGVLVALSAYVGRSVARRALQPITESSQAAMAIASGLLDTRVEASNDDDEFGAWADAFNVMATSLEDKIAALTRARDRERRLTAAVAHELKTPLSALLSEVSVLEGMIDRCSPEMRKPIELLSSDVRRLRRLIDELLEMAQVEASREDLKMKTLDLSQIVRSVIETRGWQGVVEISAEPTTLRSDRFRIERIVSNLVANALEHGDAPVEVAVRRDEGVALVEVTDKGPGVSPEDLPHLFEPFYKADRSRSRIGTGLGLSIAAENARLLGGSIEADSAPGRGATFTVRLPAAGPGHGADNVTESSHSHHIPVMNDGQAQGDSE